MRALTKDPLLNVCSPTFLLTQEYGPVRKHEGDGGGVPLVHADLYRLSAGDDLGVLGLPGVALLGRGDRGGGGGSGGAGGAGGAGEEWEEEIEDGREDEDDAPEGFALIEWPGVLVANPAVRLRNELEIKISRDSGDDSGGNSSGGGGGGGELDYEALEDATRTVSLRSDAWSSLFEQLERL